MKENNLVALDKFMREQSLTATDLAEMAEYLVKNELPLSLLYADGEVSKWHFSSRRVKAVHLENVDIGQEELSIPMSYLSALQNCRQIGQRLMTEEQAKEAYKDFENVNKVLELIGAEKLKKTRYWVETPASKSYLAKVIDFGTGKIQEVKRSECCRVRPILFKN